MRRLKHTLRKIVHSKYTLLVIVLTVPILLGLQSYRNSVNYTGPSCKHYSNYQVFKYAHFHLLGDQDLYSDHLDEHCFTFKYSPSFALFFGLFAYLPDWLGLVLWMLLSGVMTYFAIRALPGMGPPQQLLFLLFIGNEWLGTIQGQQTNSLIAMALLLAFSLLERGKREFSKAKYLPATLLIVATGFIKVFGFGTMLLYLFYPHKLRLGAYSLMWTVLLALLPLVVISPSQLGGIYEAWYGQIAGDFSGFTGMSIYSFLESVTGWEPPRLLLLSLSLVLMLAPLVQLSKWEQLGFRKLMLAAILIWVVIFNHKAESPTYVIAMAGIGLWFFAKERRRWDIALLLFAFVAGSLIYSDAVPKWFKSDISFAYHVKALPCLLVWIRIVGEMWWPSGSSFANSSKSSQSSPS